MKINSPNVKRLKPGLTLLEIMMVVGIIVIIMGAIIGFGAGFQDGPKITATTAQMNGLTGALQNYQNTTGNYPSQEQGLRALVTKPTTSPQPRRWVQLLDKMPVDAWKNEFVYKFPGKNGRTFEIISKGPDGQIDTDDDLSTQD